VQVRFELGLDFATQLVEEIGDGTHDSKDRCDVIINFEIHVFGLRNSVPLRARGRSSGAMRCRSRCADGLTPVQSNRRHTVHHQDSGPIVPVSFNSLDALRT
jgi:hypothetical protein